MLRWNPIAWMATLCSFLRWWNREYKTKDTENTRNLVFWWRCWFGVRRVKGLCSVCKLLGLLPAAGYGYSLDAVTRYQPSELTKWTSPAGRRKMNLKWNIDLVLQVSPEGFCTSCCRAGWITDCRRWLSPALQLGQLEFSQGESLTLELWLQTSPHRKADKYWHSLCKWMPDAW